MKTDEGKLNRFTDTLPQVFGVSAAAIGFVALLGWITGLPLLASFGAGLIPMAPSTALLFVMFGVAVLFRNRMPRSRATYLMGVMIASIGAVTAVLLFFSSSAGMYLQIEHVGLSISGAVEGSPIGHMSPITAIGFVVIALSFLAALSSSAGRPKHALAAVVLACLAVLITSLFLLAYFYGTPLMYGGKFIPPALPTSLAFLVLALGLLTTPGLQAWPDSGIKDAATTRRSYVLALIFVILAAGIVVAGYFYYRNYEKQYLIQVENELSAISALKVGDLAQWRKERLADAFSFFENAAVSVLARRFLEKPEDADAQLQLRSWLDKYAAHSDYDRVFLLDTRGVTRMSAPAASGPVASALLQRTSEILRSSRVAFQDFYRDEHDQRVYLALLVPILDKTNAGRPLGVLVLRIDPTTYLYPLIQRWPTASRTAETLIVRRDGNDVLFLSELKFKTNTALNLRVPLTRKDVVAVKAALGQAGIVESMDYRDAPVVASLRAIPGSPWFLVAHINVDEIYGPLRERLWVSVFLIGALLAGAAAGIGLIWRQQHSRFYRERIEAAEALSASEIRYRRLFEAAKDGILILDAETGVIVDVNPFLVELLSFSREQFLGKRVWELGFFKDLLADENNFLELQQKKYIRYEDMPLKTADGRRIDVEFVSNVYEVDHQKVIQCNIRDITQRKWAERELRLQSAALESAANSILITDRDGVITWVNAAFSKLTGYSPDEAIGRNSRFLKSGMQDQLFYENLWNTILSGQIWSGEIVNRRKDGALYTEEQIITPVRNHQGEVTHFIAIKQDITERKRAEESVKRRYAERQALQEISQIILTAPDIRITMEKILDKVTALGSYDIGVIRLLDPATDVLEPTASHGYSDPKNLDGHRKKARDDANGQFSLRTMQRTGPRVEEDVPRCDGLRTWKKEGVQSAVVVPVRTENEILGAIQLGSRTPRKFQPDEIRVLETIGDQMGIAIQKAHAQEETERHLQRINALHEIDLAITSTLDLRATLDVLLQKIDFFLPDYSATTVRLFNHESGLLEPITCRGLDETEWKAEMWKAGRGIPNAVFETKASRMVPNVQTDPDVKDPEFFHKHGLISYLGVPLIARDEVLGVLGLYTKQEYEFRAEESEFLNTLAGQAAIAIQNAQLLDQSQRQAAELERANKVKDEFLSVMSHELRTPLSVVIGYTGMVREKLLGEINPQQEDALQKVLSRAAEQLHMINSIMQTTQLESRAITLEPNLTNLSEFLAHFKSDYESTHNKDAVELRWDYPSEPVPTVIDGGKLRQILQNLIDNAIKFTDQGIVTVSMRAIGDGTKQAGAAAGKSGARWVEIKIADTGTGIATEQIPRIFDKFYQVDSSETRLYGGVGLGLYIVQKFTELLRGTIAVESKPGKGSTFTVRLPYEN